MAMRASIIQLRRVSVNKYFWQSSQPEYALRPMPKPATILPRS